MKKIQFSLLQILQIVAASTFLIGAIFMLVHTFSDQAWSFWVGLSFAVLASVAYVFLFLENRKGIFRKLTNASYSDKKDNSIEHEKVQNAKTKTPEI